MFDAVVVGGSYAGQSAALQLARARAARFLWSTTVSGATASRMNRMAS